MRVWIDQDLCTGDGLCVDHCPDVFVQLEDGIAYVAEGPMVLNDPGGGASLARVQPRHEQAVIHAALACPGECIFIEVQHAGPANAPRHAEPVIEFDDVDFDADVDLDLQPDRDPVTAATSDDFAA